MRKASQSNGLIVENDKFIGIALGYDYCAEHEWGIKDLKRICGIPDASKDNMGVKNRTITKCPPLMFKEETYKKKNFAILYTGQPWYEQKQMENLPHDLKNWKDDLIRNEEWNNKYPDTRSDKDNIITAWDGGSFGVAVMGEKEVKWLKELKAEIEKKNLTIAVADLRAKNPFAGSSLCLLISDRIPQETLDAMYYGDKSHFDLVDYEKEIGMTDLKEKTRKSGYHNLHYYMACSPRWIDYDDEKNREALKKKLKTKYNIQYWINYSDDDNNYGWYSVEEIREWLSGTKKLTEIRKAH
jgi:hypothetical protein